MRSTVAILAAALAVSSFFLIRLVGPEAPRCPALAPPLSVVSASVVSAPATANPIRPFHARGRASSEPLGTPPPPAATLASVVSWLSVPGGAHLDGVAVLLRHGSRLIERGELRDGQGRFTGLVPGRYSLEVDATSLPSGWLAPPCAPTHGTRTPFVLGRGERREIALDVVRAATVQGFVHGPDGAPVPGATIRLQGTQPGRQLLQAMARSDERGHYELLDVLPGAYRAQVRWPVAVCAAPPPAPSRHVFGADACHAVDFRGEPVSRSLRGRLVDAEGRAATGVTVVCEGIEEEPQSAGGGHRAAEWSRVLARTTTDDEGVFRLPRLPAAVVAVRVAPRLGSATGLRTRAPELEETLAGPFDLFAASDALDLGTVVVRPHACQARGPTPVRTPSRASSGS